MRNFVFRKFNYRQPIIGNTLIEYATVRLGNVSGTTSEYAFTRISVAPLLMYILYFAISISFFECTVRRKAEIIFSTFVKQTVDIY